MPAKQPTATARHNPRTLCITVDNRTLRRAQALEDDCHEILELAAAAQLDVLLTHTVRLRTPRPHPATYLRSGAIQRVGKLLALPNISHVVFNVEITPTQIRNLEKAWQVVVLDRTDLILAIFSRRAKSHEGKLQVQLAQCRHQLGRLAGQWTHLERQRGGIGVRGGPGEKQIELDKRMLARRIASLEKQIQKIAMRNQLAQRQRSKNRIMSVALVGYTNAGKSSLFNALSRGDTPTNDRLFDTLDSLSRRVYTHKSQFYLLTDTVGFIRDLPHHLVEGFRTTLQETAHSHVLLVVVDRSDTQWDDRLRTVQDILADIGYEHAHQIIVYNKIDKTDEAARIVAAPCGRLHHAYVSCQHGEGIPALQTLLADLLQQHHRAHALPCV